MPPESMEADAPTQDEMRERMSRMCELMPALKDCPGVRPWDAERFMLAQHGRSHGEKVAASFAMTVWSGGARHPLKPFCMADAAAVCDQKTRRVMAGWLGQPFWP